MSLMPTAPRLSERTGASPEGRTPALHDRAADNLRFIRDTMALAGAFTSVSGRGMMLVGVVGLAASALASGKSVEQDATRWLAVWVAAALVAGAVSWVTIRSKAAHTGQSLSARPPPDGRARRGPRGGSRWPSRPRSPRAPRSRRRSPSAGM